MAIAKKMPTPKDTVRINTIFGTPDTCPARICRSGSEMVTRIPMIKLRKAISHTCFAFPRKEPIFVPKGCMDISAPMVKMASPAIRQSTPIKNSKKVLVLSGVSVTPNSKTMAAMGKMEVRDS